MAAKTLSSDAASRVHQSVGKNRMDIAIRKISTPADPLLPSLVALLPQLSSQAQAPSNNYIADLLSQGCTTFLVAADEQTVYGTTTLVTYSTLTGVRCRIEDVVVSEEARGHGLGRQLTAKAVDLARNSGARTIDLTSRPSREAANAMYRKMGFEIRDSNSYRLTLGP